MRRKDREIRNKKLQKEILENTEALRIAFAVDNEPYIVAMNFGFEWDDHLRLYLHCAREGKKIDMLEHNNRVCFQTDTDRLLIVDDQSCRWSMNYASVVGYGTISIVGDEEERIHGLELLMKNYGKKGKNSFAAEMLQAIHVLRIDVREITAKRKIEA